MNHYKIQAMVFAGVLAAAGCASNKSSPDAAQNASPGANANANAKANQGNSSGDVFQNNSPASSPFSQIKEGMSQKQVQDILGPPTDQANYQTGKAFIPFYFGNDVMRFEQYYKGMGRIVFTGVGIGGVNLRVKNVIYDPSEDGYSNTK